MDCIMEGRAGPVGEEIRPLGAHPSLGSVGRRLLGSRVCLLEVKGRGGGHRVGAPGTAARRPWLGTCGCSHSHTFLLSVGVS